MSVDLNNLQTKLRKKLNRLEKERTELEDKLEAIELVIKTSEELTGFEEPSAEDDPRRKEKPTFELSEEDAILEILKTFQKPMDSKAIANELTAVGYPFTNGNPVDSVDVVLKKLLNDGKIARTKGDLFAIS